MFVNRISHMTRSQGKIKYFCYFPTEKYSADWFDQKIQPETAEVKNRLIFQQWLYYHQWEFQSELFYRSNFSYCWNAFSRSADLNVQIAHISNYTLHSDEKYIHYMPHALAQNFAPLESIAYNPYYVNILWRPGVHWAHCSWMWIPRALWNPQNIIFLVHLCVQMIFKHYHKSAFDHFKVLKCLSAPLSLLSLSLWIFLATRWKSAWQHFECVCAPYNPRESRIYTR